MIPKRHICGELVFQDEQGRYHHRFDRDGNLPPMRKCPLCGNVIEDGWFRPLYKVEPMTNHMMLYTVKQRNCSNCWNHGFQVHDVEVEAIDPETLQPTGEFEKMHLVLCSSCLEETQGYVTSMYIGEARLRDYQDASRSFIHLAPVLGVAIHWERRSIAENIAQLGF